MPGHFSIYIWKKAPFFRLLLSLIAGIIAGYYLRIPLDYLLSAGTILILLIIGFSFLPKSFRFRFRFLQGFALQLIICITGMLLVWTQDVRHKTNWYGNNLDNAKALVVRIIAPPEEKAKSIKVMAEILSLENKDSSIKADGKVLLYFSKDSLLPELQYGQVLAIKNKLVPITNSGNPGAFDYKRYLAFQQIHHQAFLRNSDFTVSSLTLQNRFWNWVFASRNYVLNVLQNNIPSEQESSLASALVIGYRGHLDKDLIQAYSNAGVVHLIAISGLHLAVIYGLLLWLTLRIPLLKSSPIWRVLFILFCLWFFSFLTGSPPSVMRAALMFSFISLGTLFQKHGSIFNSMAVSAFLLLCYDPFLLWNVGFQLSYLAVLGIVICQKPIYHWFYFKNKVGDYLWAMASVSIAAQIFTIPLCFFYFHQLPLLFLLANMIAIPLSTVALWSCIAMIAVSPIPFFSMVLGKISWTFLWLMNHAVLFINELPLVTWNKISISVLDTFILYAIMIALLLWLFIKKTFYLKASLLALILFFGLLALSKWETHHQKKLVVYHIPRHHAMDFILGNQFYFQKDTTFVQEPQLLAYNILPARIFFKANYSSDDMDVVSSRQGFYQFQNKRIVVIDSAIKYQPMSHRIKIDYLIVTHNPSIKLKDLQSVFDASCYIFDGANTSWRTSEWKKECEELNLRYHITQESGAFIAAF